MNSLEVKKIEKVVEELRELNNTLRSSYLIKKEEISDLLFWSAELIVALDECCTQRGERMQKMKEWMDEIILGYRTDWDVFLDKNPEAFNWFDENGNVR